MEQEQKEQFLFKKENYILFIAGIAAIVIGFLLMGGGGSDDPTVFSREIFSFRRITLAPAVVLLGFCVIMYAIMKKPKAD
ncbi:MAG: hypothetical protein COA57_08820 [Flavobacteriales bacterium]|nr:MAG: hypothetical protein COA57_08820 [Flavobacteriales bacterium]